LYFSDGSVYRGEVSIDSYHRAKTKKDGYGLYKCKNGHEYHGFWEQDTLIGYVVKKDGYSGRVERIFVEFNKLAEVLEVIEEGR
jgi:hypothetical protein